MTCTRFAVGSALTALLAGCAGGTELAVTTFGHGGNTDGVGQPTGDAGSSAGDASATDTRGASTSDGDDGSPSGASADGPDPDTSGGDDCRDEELCDGVDNTCDDLVDEGCACTPGQTQDCYSGDAGTQGTGACRSGLQLCDDGGTWGACDDEVTPSPEACNGVDDDCDGQIDEDFGTEVCGEGICQVSVATCTDGVPATCTPGPAAPVESCNGVDDDCDGEVDEGCDCIDGEVQGCYAGPAGTQGVGVCTGGTQSCQNGAWSACAGSVLPSPETCDGLDNDCDMAADEGNPGGGGACATGLLGACGTGVLTCSGGALGCPQTVNPQPEICGNGVDDDCNGVVDDGCGCVHGLCTTGAALTPSECGSCVVEICAVDPYCCNNNWDSACVSQVATVCASWECSTCAHSPCVTGGVLVNGCDAGVGGCVGPICSVDPFCCVTAWDALCVGRVASVCGIAC